ncbi:MAG: dipeptidase [Microbacteriaceae bacterium]
MSQEISGNELHNAVELNFAHTIAELSNLVRIPSVSWDGYDQEQVQHSAEYVANLFSELGVFERVTIERSTESNGNLGRPAVLASRKAKNGRPSILLYAHHDVQPWGNEADWLTPPFEPSLKGERLYGRGASDDKAGVMVHYAAIQALSESQGADFDLGITVFIEGEEEHGSRSFANFLSDHADVLNAEVIIVADSDNWDTETPSLTVALRGNVAFVLTVKTLEHASHSGMYGGAAPDAPLAAIRLLNSLWNEDGSVAVAGLISREGAVPEFTEAELATDAGFSTGVQSIGSGEVLSRIWNQAAITVTGMDIPSVRDASNTLTPEVRVKISARIAPGQDAAEAYQSLKAHLEANAPFGAHLEFNDIDLGNPFLVDTSGEYVAEMKTAMAEGWGKEPVETGIGGSIPFIADLVRMFPAAQILVTGVEDPGTMAHSPNESQHLGVLRKAIHTEAILLARLNQKS